MNIEKYTKLHNEIMTRLEVGKITTETAKEMNDIAFDKYIADDLYYERSVLLEALNDENYGDDFYYESSKIIKNIKDSLNKESKTATDNGKEKLNIKELHNAVQLAVKKKNIETRIEMASKDKEFKNSNKYKDMQKNLKDVTTEYETAIKNFSKSDMETLKKHIAMFEKSHNSSVNGIKNPSKPSKTSNAISKQVKEDHLRFADKMHQDEFNRENQRVLNDMAMNNN